VARDQRFSKSQSFTIPRPPGVRLRTLSAIVARSETVAFSSRRASCPSFLRRCRRRLISLRRSLDGTVFVLRWFSDTSGAARLAPEVPPQPPDAATRASGNGFFCTRSDFCGQRGARACSRRANRRSAQRPSAGFGRGTVPSSLRENRDSPRVILRPPPRIRAVTVSASRCRLRARGSVRPRRTRRKSSDDRPARCRPAFLGLRRSQKRGSHK